MEKFEEILEKLKYCHVCGICTASCPVAKLIPGHYNPRSLLQHLLFDLGKILKGSGIWLCAWCYRCYKICPQMLNVPEILLSVKNMASEGENFKGYLKALEIIRKEIPLPAACCYVCFHLERCEVSKPLVIEALRQFITDYELEAEEAKALELSKEKVAVVGSGPGGLTVSRELIKKGYKVTVFESLPKLGGMLRVGIPEFRLPKRVVDVEIRYLENLGVEFKTDRKVGKDLTIDDLLREHEAVLLGIGAHKSGKLDIEGRNLEGVFDALEFLARVNAGEKIELGEKVTVVGGGNVAIDAARTALRLGAKKIQVLYRRSREEMPANPWEVKETENEGIKIQFLIAPTKILGKEGRITAIECIRMRLGRPDETGRRRPIPIENSTFTIESDAIISAIGETPDLSHLPKEIGVGEGNTIAVDPFSFRTNLPSVFACGDAVSGPATVIEAILAGKNAAASIDEYLQKGKRAR